MNNAQLQRYRFIEICLEKYGEIGRRIVMDYFGISQAQVTKDIKEYSKLAPDNIRYSASKKRYLKNPEFERTVI